ncbi:hypothetical protein IF650_06815 [Cellulosimicrobium terreum]|nr:hypothetical protein [Cellulosimicrobium terreum]
MLVVVVVALGLSWALVAVVTTDARPPDPELDLMTEYRTLAELEDVASDLVLVEPTGEQRTERIGSSAFVVTQVRVVGSGTGPISVDDVIEIRQDGGRWINAAPALDPVPGTQYLAYVHPWTLLDEADTGQHVVAGAQGLWRVSGSDGRLVTVTSPLPRRVEISGQNDDLTVTS